MKSFSRIACIGILLALFHRGRTGEGQAVSASLAHTATVLQAPTMIDHATKVWDEPAGQELRGRSVGDHLYRGSDDRWFYVVADGALGVDPDTFTDVPAAESATRLVAAGHSAHLVLTGPELVDDAVAVGRGLSLGDNVGVVHRLSRSPLADVVPAGVPGADGFAVVAALGLADRWPDLVAAGTVVETG